MTPRTPVMKRGTRATRRTACRCRPPGTTTTRPFERSETTALVRGDSSTGLRVPRARIPATAQPTSHRLHLHAPDTAHPGGGPLVPHLVPCARWTPTPSSTRSTSARSSWSAPISRRATPIPVPLIFSRGCIVRAGGLLLRGRHDGSRGLCAAGSGARTSASRLAGKDSSED